jgi:protein-tyrosine phosphatase
MNQIYKSLGQHTIILAILMLPSAAFPDRPNQNQKPAHPSHQSKTVDLSNTRPEQSRLLPIENTRNTRDLGGYNTVDGRRVKWGVLFRSDNLANLNNPDLRYLQQLRLATVTDLRSESERTLAPSRLPRQSPRIQYQTLEINNPKIDVAALGRKFYSGQLSEAELLALTDRTEYINNTALSRTWGRWVADLAKPGALPHLFHCTAGKDRTGFAAAIILLTLGVSKQQVMEDFLLTNQYLASHIETTVNKIQANSTAPVNPDVLRQVIGVTPDSLEGAFKAMETQYGSIQLYIEQGLGIDKQTQAKLRELLLE